MKRIFGKKGLPALVLMVGFLLPAVAGAGAMIPGINGPTFNLTARTGSIVTDDGNNIFMWGYANGTGRMQYPGPTLIVNQGDLVTVTLNNLLTVPTSIVFPGQRVTATGGIPGLLTREAPPGGSATYSFTASEPGTYIYYSGTRPEIQVEMGLKGALIVRPTGGGFGPTYGYNHADSYFDHEYLFLLDEVDDRVHRLIQLGRIEQVDNTKVFPVYWFINGRAGFDTLAPNNAPYFPNQPYSAVARMHPGDKVLVRMVGGGRDLHPFHLHGNHHRVIARDGRMLKGPLGEDFSEAAFTTTVGPGQTFDAIFTWTGEKLGWDVYGHQQDIDNPPTGNFPGPEDIDHNGNGILDNVAPEPNEYLPDHGKPFPVSLPSQDALTFGPLYTGSPFLGASGNLPPGEGGFNPNSGLPFMWHSHSEKELTSNNIFPGGMLTFIIIEHPNVPIP